MIDLSIIIPTLNTSGDVRQDVKIRYALKECLLSLQETVPDIPIVVVSNNDDPRLLPMETWDKVKRINIWEQGQCKAVNAGVAVTNTEWVMISNDDMIYPPGWLRYAEMAVINSDFNCVSPILIEPQDGAPTFIKYPCGGAGGDFDKQKFLEFVFNENNKKTKQDDFVIRKGFNLPFLIKRELWDLVGGYDINYDPWGSNGDSDLEYKIKLAGIQPVQCNFWLVYHFSQTSGTFHPKNQEYWNKNFEYFEEKWGFPRTDDGIWTADFEIPLEKLKFKPKWAKLTDRKSL